MESHYYPLLAEMTGNIVVAHVKLWLQEKSVRNKKRGQLIDGHGIQPFHFPEGLLLLRLNCLQDRPELAVQGDYLLLGQFLFKMNIERHKIEARWASKGILNEIEAIRSLCKDLKVIKGENEKEKEVIIQKSKRCRELLGKLIHNIKYC